MYMHIRTTHTAGPCNIVGLCSIVAVIQYIHPYMPVSGHTVRILFGIYNAVQNREHETGILYVLF